MVTKRFLKVVRDSGFMKAEFDETKHPRGHGGRFAPKGQGGQVGKEPEDTTENINGQQEQPESPKIATFDIKKEQVNTPEFKQWFDGSRVVDDSGNPLVVYHGTDHDFSEFGNATNVHTQNLGIDTFWFTTNKAVASTYINKPDEGGHVKAVYLSMKNPLVIEADGRMWDDVANEISEKFQVYHTPTEKEFRDYSESLQQKYDPEDHMSYDEYENALSDEEHDKLYSLQAQFQKELQSLYSKQSGVAGHQRLPAIGTQYDGVIIHGVWDQGAAPVKDEYVDEGGDYKPFADVYMVVKPTQIKSATHNNGNFNANSADITKAEMTQSIKKVIVVVRGNSLIKVDFDETKHPRGHGGRFAPKGQGKTGGGEVEGDVGRVMPKTVTMTRKPMKRDGEKPPVPDEKKPEEKKPEEKKPEEKEPTPSTVPVPDTLPPRYEDLPARNWINSKMTTWWNQGNAARMLETSKNPKWETKDGHAYTAKTIDGEFRAQRMRDDKGDAYVAVAYFEDGGKVGTFANANTIENAMHQLRGKVQRLVDLGDLKPAIGGRKPPIEPKKPEKKPEITPPPPPVEKPAPWGDSIDKTHWMKDGNTTSWSWESANRMLDSLKDIKWDNKDVNEGTAKTASGEFKVQRFRVADGSYQFAVGYFEDGKRQGRMYGIGDSVESATKNLQDYVESRMRTGVIAKPRGVKPPPPPPPPPPDKPKIEKPVAVKPKEPEKPLAAGERYTSGEHARSQMMSVIPPDIVSKIKENEDKIAELEKVREEHSKHLLRGKMRRLGSADAIKEHNDHVKGFNDALHEANMIKGKNILLQKKYTAEVRKRLAVDSPSDVSVSSITIKGESSRKMVYEGFDEFNKLVDRDVIGKRNAVDIRSARGRSSYSVGLNRINFAPIGGKSTIIHELGHHIEHINPRAKKAAQEFFARRTAGEKTVSLSSISSRRYKSGEATRKDKFYDPYVGKMYYDGSTEVISMGLEAYYSKPIEFAKVDPEHFDLIFNIVHNKF